MSQQSPAPRNRGGLSTEVIVAIISTVGVVLAAAIGILPTLLDSEGDDPAPQATSGAPLAAATAQPAAPLPTADPAPPATAPPTAAAAATAALAPPTASAAQPATAAPTATPAAEAPGSFAFTERLQTDPERFETTLTLVEVLPNSTMRWTFDMWNKAGAPYDVFMANGSYVVDDLGNRYDIVDALGVNVQAGERTSQSITFPAPEPGSSTFSLYINNSIGVQFPNPPIVVSLR